uniref:NADH dehydrogenase subunit 2 n=1 Tax=Laemobothrion atrum TaxID=179170 RepID=UPI00257A1654|nr:NADH dehydrogenase subunit 2 [Laemobothrion atrum]WGU50353.1 NADH dehydrogenase subunit 2 [Laemobothrion atrum]
MLLSLMLLFSMLAISSPNWWGGWLGMELLGFVFVTWLAVSGSKILKMKIFSYMVVQMVTSSGFFIACLMSAWGSGETFYQLIYLSLLVKMGCFPFHGWLVSISEGVSFMSLFLLFTLLKVPPLGLMSSMCSVDSLTLALLLGGLSLAPLTYPSGSIRLLLTYSSIIQVSWLVLSALLGKTILIFTFYAYAIALSMPMKVLDKWGVSKLSSLLTLPGMMKGGLVPLLWSVSFLSLMGVPPLLGFYPKLWVISSLFEGGAPLLGGLILGLSVLPMFIYMKLVILIFLSMKVSSKSFVYQNPNTQGVGGLNLFILLMMGGFMWL